MRTEYPAGLKRNFGSKKGKHAAHSQFAVSEIVQNIVVAIFSLVCIAVFIYRILHGIDFSDESFYVSMGFRLAKGNSIFVDMWEQCSTSALLPSILLKGYMHFFGTNGIVAFYRIAFFVVNAAASLLLFHAFRFKLDRNMAILAALSYLVFAPFHVYSFSYNNCADMFLMLAIASWLIYAWGGRCRWMFVGGCMCALLVLTYPTMIVLAAIMVLYSIIREKKAGLLFLCGVCATGALLLLAIFSQIGVSGIRSGIEGILADPAYNVENISFALKLRGAFEYYLSPIIGNHLILQIFFGWMIVVFCLRNKYPALKLTLLLYPIAAFIEAVIYSETTRLTGTFVFYVAFIGPFLILYTERYKKIFKEIVAILWVPSFFYYLIISYSSAGGAVQGVQGFILAAIMTVIFISFISREVIEDRTGASAFIARIPGLAAIALFVVLEICALWNVVYRDSGMDQLSYPVDSGPYAGIFTTYEKKSYIDFLNEAAAELREPGKNALVLYHDNFVYPFLNMEPFTPTVWGIYPFINNQGVFKKYFDEHESLPDYIYIANVPENLNEDYFNEDHFVQSYSMNAVLYHLYELEDEISLGEGSLKKYKCVKPYEEAQEILRIAFA